MKNTSFFLTKINFFKPLIASTLASSLSHFAFAKCVSDTPIMCYGDKTANSEIRHPIMSWKMSSNDKNTYYIPIVNVTTAVNMTIAEPVDLIVEFKDKKISGSSWEITGVSINLDDKSYIVTARNKFFLIKGKTGNNTKGIMLGDNGEKKLKINFANKNTEENFTLDLSETNTNQESLKGNIEITDEKNKSPDDASKHTTNFKLKEGMKGNITLAAKSKNTFEVTSKNINVDKLTIQNGDTTFDFKDSSNNGKLEAKTISIENIYDGVNKSTIILKRSGENSNNANILEAEKMTLTLKIEVTLKLKSSKATLN